MATNPTREDDIVGTFGDVTMRVADVHSTMDGQWLNDNAASFALECLERAAAGDPDTSALLAASGGGAVALGEGALRSVRGGGCVAVQPGVVFLVVSADFDVSECVAADRMRGAGVLLLPVNNNRDSSRVGGTHWSLLAFDKATRTFYHMDSMGSLNYSAACCVARKFSSLLKLEETRSVVSVTTPLQKNGTDCGFHMLCMCHALLNLAGANDPPSISADQIEAALKKSATPQCAQAMRRLLQQLIFVTLGYRT
ncbi:cysteine proteinase [Pelomyxa schiedti]|nr:cysteine proteinase [Pelomyxa schiedti]